VRRVGSFPSRRIVPPLGAALLVLSSSSTASTQALEYRFQTLRVDGVVRAVRVPAGYALEVVTSKLDGPRFLTFAGNGDLFIGSHSGNVYRLPPPYDHSEVLVRLGDYPHSVALRSGEILIGRTDGVYRAPYQPGQARLSPEDVSLLARLPGGGGHSSRSVAVGPDGRVYVSLGIQSNCSDQYLGGGYPFEDRRGGVMVLDERNGSPHWQPYASGLRNPVGFDWQPGTHVLYAANNGPDHWGYDLPPEYFSLLAPDSFHGMPWFEYDGERLRRDDCIRRTPPRPERDVTLPVATFPARGAPLGMAFVPRGAMEASLAGDAIVALHGSWGTRPSGGSFGDPATRRPPKVVAVRFERGQARRVDDLITGFQLDDGERWARPAGVAIGPDGALYLTSDEGANALFRLRKTKR
jgi:glucose/arabinose dehydrogenase